MKIILFFIIFFPASINLFKHSVNRENIAAKKYKTIPSKETLDATDRKNKEAVIISAETLRIKETKKTSNSTHKKEYFKLLNAASESWSAGAANGGSGIDYSFKIKIKTPDKIVFDSAWISGKAYSIYITKKTKTVSSQPIKYVNGDTITLKVSDIHSAKIKNNNPANNNPPINYKGAALIAYSVNGIREYFIVKEIKKQKSINRQ